MTRSADSSADGNDPEGPMSRTRSHSSSFLSAAKALALLVAIAAAPTLAQAETITGTAEVTSPYTFQLGDYRVFLLGVDSVELTQTCRIGDQQWECWAAAQRALETVVSVGEVTCETLTDPDPVGRVIATCTIDGQDVGELFVETGFGLAIPTETTQYVEAEDQARAAGIGLWQGTFDPPNVWRMIPMRPQSNRPRYVPAD